MNVDVIGYVAGMVGLSIAFPQIIKTIIRKSVKDLSLHTQILAFTCNSLWSTYGYLIWNLPMLITGMVAATTQFTLICLILKYNRKRK